jgi:hypothetical protein
MNETSSTPTSACYELPVYTLENAPAVTVNTVAEDSGALPEEHIKVRVDRESGYILAEKTTANRTSTFEFDIVEGDANICAYRGNTPNRLPTAVVHALYETGFSLTEYNATGRWFQIWLENRLIGGCIDSLTLDTEDALAEAAYNAVKDELGFLDELFGTRFVTGNDEDYQELEGNGKYGVAKRKAPDGTEQTARLNDIPGMEGYGDPRGTVVNESAPHLLIEKPATEYDNHEYFNLIVSDGHFPPVGVRTHENEDGGELYVDTVSEFGVHRATFNIINDSSCSYTGEQPASCLSSYVLDAVNQAGYEVEDAVNIFNNPTGYKQVAACDNKLRAIWRSIHHTKPGQPDSMIDRNLHSLRSNLLTLFAALALHEIMPGRYEKHVKMVGNRCGEEELYAKSIHYLMQIHAKSNASDRDDLTAYLSELDHIQEDIVGKRMESLNEVAVKIGIIWHAIEDEMHPPRR